jgi:hypothetical protein
LNLVEAEEKVTRFILEELKGTQVKIIESKHGSYGGQGAYLVGGTFLDADGETGKSFRILIDDVDGNLLSKKMKVEPSPKVLFSKP